MDNRDCIKQQTGSNATLQTQGCPWDSRPGEKSEDELQTNISGKALPDERMGA